ncbi:MAG: GNAT family N-acetyltransferase [Actinomycetota bacterium]|nr:GNAT family N-acetyltransferase [Actinomycetota bacterium]
MTDVVLELIDASNWREALEVRVHDEQLAFVADHQPVALVILAKCFVRPGGRRWEPLLVRDRQGAAVGVFALTHGADDCEVRNFAIDARRQREGLGTAAVRAVIDRARQPDSDCEELLVTAHPANHAAHNVYRSAGFVSMGQERDGEPVFRFKLDRSGAR